MTPSTLLALWRDRWAKPAINVLFVPYRDSALSKYLEDFALAPAWRSRPWRWSVRLLSALAALGVIALPLTPNAQIVFAFVIAAVVVYVRRFAGGVLPWTLASVSLVLSLRYFLWRVGQSLPTHADMLDFAWAYALCCAEFLLWLCGALAVVQRLWPLHQTPQRLTGQPVNWPTVDVVLWVDGADLESLQAQWKALQGLEWPVQRINFHAACPSEPANAVTEWARAQGLALAIDTKTAHDPWSAIVGNTDDLQADFTWFVGMCAPPVDPMFLQDTLGWFAANPSLALLHTPAHPLATKVPHPTLALDMEDKRAQHALVRRRAVQEALPALDTDPNPGPIDRAAHLQAQGWDLAWLVLAAPTITCIYQQAHAWPLKVYAMLQALLERLRFYRPVAHTIWILAPVSVLWLQSLPIQGTLLTLGAFLLPHWLMAQVAIAASESQGRLTFSLLLRELVLPLHLLVRTTQSFVRTQWRHFWLRWRGHSAVRDPALPWAQWGFNLAWFAANAWACAHALQALRTSPFAWNASLLVWMALWAAWNAMQAVSALAIEKEARLVEQTRTQRRKVQAMVQWPGQRPLPCVTSDFPQTTLTLEWPASVRLQDSAHTAQPVFFSLFHGHHEYPFEGHVLTIQDNRLQLQVAPVCVSAYRTLASAIFSRDAQWPRWLPARDADNLLPSRLRALLNTLETAFYNLTVQAALSLWVQRLRNWLRPGKHHHV